MIVLVCGGRKYCDQGVVFLELDRLHKEHPFSLLIEGGCSGADRLAKLWAKDRRVPWKEFKASWNMHGRAAGPIRNQKMLDEGKPDLIVAFPGHDGTADMVSRGKAAGVRVMEIDG